MDPETSPAESAQVAAESALAAADAAVTAAAAAQVEEIRDELESQIEQVAEGVAIVTEEEITHTNEDNERWTQTTTEIQALKSQAAEMSALMNGLQTQQTQLLQTMETLSSQFAEAVGALEKSKTPPPPSVEEAPPSQSPEAMTENQDAAGPASKRRRVTLV